MGGYYCEAVSVYGNNTALYANIPIFPFSCNNGVWGIYLLSAPINGVVGIKPQIPFYPHIAQFGGMEFI